VPGIELASIKPKLSAPLYMAKRGRLARIIFAALRARKGIIESGFV
jgi:hypothetical protein